jgi:hypothetical protein
MASPKRHLNCKKPNKTGASGSSAVKLWPQEILYMGPRKKQTQIGRRRKSADFTNGPETLPSMYDLQPPRTSSSPPAMVQVTSSKSPSRESAPENAGKSTLKWGPERLLNCKEHSKTRASTRVGPKTLPGGNPKMGT